MKVFFDTEFPCIYSTTLDLISAGFIADDGRELYLEIADFDHEACSTFVLDTVLPLLDAPKENVIPIKQFGLRLVEWLNAFDAPVELVCDFDDDRRLVEHFSATALAQLTYPPKWLVWAPNPSFEYKCANISDEFWSAPQNIAMQHHALFDARCLRHVFLTAHHL